MKKEERKEHRKQLAKERLTSWMFTALKDFKGNFKDIGSYYISRSTFIPIGRDKGTVLVPIINKKTGEYRAIVWRNRKLMSTNFSGLSFTDHFVDRYMTRRTPKPEDFLLSMTEDLLWSGREFNRSGYLRVGNSGEIRLSGNTAVTYVNHRVSNDFEGVRQVLSRKQLCY